MSTRRTWLLGVAVLISIGWLIACGSHFSPSSQGLVIVPSQGSAVLQAFSFDLATGRSAQINTSPATNGKPAAVIQDRAGAYVYVAVVPDPTNPNSVQAPSIISYKINSDGTLAAGTALGMTPSGANNVTPAAFALDSAGKFLFVADQLGTNSSGATVAGTVSVFTLNNGSVTEVAGSPFAVPTDPGGIAANPLGLAVSPTSFPVNTATGASECAGLTAPTTENLYVTDANNNEVFEFAVDSSSGALSPVQRMTTFGIATGALPWGVAVDPCNRFVYVANNHDNNVSGYTICNAPSVPNCPSADGSLVSIGAPTPAANGPTVMAIDPLGNFLYVVDSLQNAISGYKISPVGGALTALSPTATGAKPVSIAIRSDDTWLFVTNNGSGATAGSLSQFSITPASGALAPLPAITTDNFPWGVAVK